MIRNAPSFIMESKPNHELEYYEGALIEKSLVVTAMKGRLYVFYRFHQISLHLTITPMHILGICDMSWMLYREK